MFWLSDAQNAWQGMIGKGIKPQAVIVNGAEGVGKRALLAQIIPVMLCSKSDEQACGECQSCRLNHAGHHPDVLTVTPENNLVKVGMIRDLTDFFVSTPHCSQHKIAVIHQAHLMNNSAANALLKVLEEPPSSGTLFLLSEAKHHLLPTIRSRCISLDIAIPESIAPEVYQWLVSQYDNEKEVLAIHPLMSGEPLSALACLKAGVLTEFIAFLDDVCGFIVGQDSLVAVVKKWHETIGLKHLEMWQQLNMLLLKECSKQPLNKKWSGHQFSKLLKKEPQSADLIIKMNDLIQGVVLKFNTQLKKQLMLESLLFQIKQRIS
ncbi:hypothetical protein [Marinicella rhabdoformis]|uniref:hypothetical protein n=1 Tax=Marinicella rhabdoformis TaxID=2580566 RepID=UPI001FE30C2A|nr:hypothetical protein [Marinicella rhabdoformis]